jgi:outer membrane receptor protein involved in Fe transport
LRRIVNDRTLFVLPNSHLDPEQTLRAGATGGLSWMGFDLALDASLRRLDQGISWVSSEGDADTGTWQNHLKMDASRLTGTLGRQGRFLGWARMKLEGTWQKYDITEGTAWRLPPENYIRLEMLWENHFFQEDGILQLALLSTRRGEMSDPWDPSGLSRLSSATWHDLVLGFRLVGAHISFAFRNLTDQRYATSANTLAPGREMDMRLRWVFHY